MPYGFSVKTVSIQELEAKLSALVAEAAAGTPIVITRHKRAVAQLVPVQYRDHIGEDFGKAKLRALLKNATGAAGSTAADALRCARPRTRAP